MTLSRVRAPNERGSFSPLACKLAGRLDGSDGLDTSPSACGVFLSALRPLGVRFRGPAPGGPVTPVTPRRDREIFESRSCPSTPTLPQRAPNRRLLLRARRARTTSSGSRRRRWAGRPCSATPLAAGWLLRANARAAQNEDGAKLALWSGIGGTLLLFALALVLPDSMPGSLLGVVTALTAHSLTKLQWTQRARRAPFPSPRSVDRGRRKRTCRRLRPGLPSGPRPSWPCRASP